MKIDIIKEDLNTHIGDKALIKYNMGRNKIESYDVIIKELYNRIFIVEVIHNNIRELKSFSYSDIINKTIKVSF